MGDCRAIYDIAQKGGLGIAFNYNEALERFLKNKLKIETIAGQILFVDRKSDSSNLMHVVPHLIN